ncbi:hypothetical protein SAY87_031499 [Trapa incisa]|uniref:Uncharacterized protein n=1 Tax=Trapa incisa TaxID=236973 RepID=A0AAN7KPT7_9MYRT|nr:hypothetical protein SAY87_031499 [Trapa incisa]
MTISEKVEISQLYELSSHMAQKLGSSFYVSFAVFRFFSLNLPRVLQKRAKVHFKKDHILASKTNPNLSNRNLRVAVIGGGGFAGGLAEEMLVKGVDTFTMERKLDNCKPCSCAIPICMVGEFDLPLYIINRKVTKMKMISPSNVTSDQWALSENGHVKRPECSSHTTALILSTEEPKVEFGQKKTLEVDAVTGANSKVAKSINVGDYECAIAFQVRRLSDVF